MKRILYLVALGLLVGLLAGCGVSRGVSRRDQLQQLGLLNQLDLRRIEQTSGINGHYDGSFFLGSGSISGDQTLEKNLQFYWGRTADEVISTTLPYSHFRFIIDDYKLVPTIEFVFDEKWLNSAHAVYTESQKSNLNLWLSDEMVRERNLRVAVVRISQEDFENMVYSP